VVHNAEKVARALSTVSRIPINQIMDLPSPRCLTSSGVNHTRHFENGGVDSQDTARSCHGRRAASHRLR
jgi:hypothetical protein